MEDLEEMEDLEDLGVRKSPAVCPACGANDWDEHHHQGSFAIPECVYKECEDCGYQWDHQ